MNGKARRGDTVSLVLLVVAATGRELEGVDDGLVCGVGPVDAAAATARALSSCSRVGSSARRLRRAQPRYCVLASSSRSAERRSASAIISPTRSRF
jgi:hypothetical protein